jgi:hypothetical protein
MYGYYWGFIGGAQMTHMTHNRPCALTLAYIYVFV